ncbi:NAD(P)-binding protein [Hypomontagnella submonticulosa]|nr:NAD(P)-binding protein [Hypomontagnella submonticulosa]
MSKITTVAIAGASGNVGPHVIKQLVEDGFKVTVLARKGTNHTFPSSVAVAEIDYESPETLVKALQGQDAVVSAVGFAGLPQQIPLIHAAAKAGVKRFIPSEYGGVTENAKSAALPAFRPKREALDALKQETASGLTYTLIATGPFLDMGVDYGFLVNLKGKSITLWNGGDRPFSATTMASTAKAISGVLQHPEETKNRGVFVHSVHKSLKELFEIAKKVTGPEGWKAEVKNTEDALKEGYAKLEKGEMDRMAFIASSIWGEGYGCDFQKVDNELLGVKQLSDAELESFLRERAK